MSVPVQDPINQVVIVGGEIVLPWTWNLQKEEEITVLVQRALDGSIDTLILNSDYTVEANDLDNDNGGEITPIGSESPVTTGDVWTLFRVTAIDRSPDFATSGAFFALTINEQLDELTRIAQDINRDSAEAVRKDPGVGDALDRNIPQPVDRRALVFSDKGGGDFEMVMSEFDPDTTAADAEASAAAAAASAAAASSSETNAGNSETNAAQSASDASDSADEAAASAAAAAGLYGQVLEVNTNTVITSSQSGFLITVDTSGGDVDITLPDSASLGGDFRVAVSKLTSDANQVNVKVAGSDTVNQGTADIIQNIQNRIVDYVLDQSEAEYTASNVEEILSETLNTNGFPINTSRSTVASAATTADIFANDIGNEIDFTGSTGPVTDFPDAPRAGASRILHIASTPTFTNNANFFVQGNADYIANAGDVVHVHAITVSTFRLTILKADGTPVVGGGYEEAGEVDLTSGSNNIISGLPSGLTDIIILFHRVSSTSATNYQLRLGDSGGIEASGYTSSTARIQTSTASTASDSAFWRVGTGAASSNTMTGIIRVTRMNSSTNEWIITGGCTLAGSINSWVHGVKLLSGELTQIQTLVSAGTFDGDGSWNIWHQ